jgi:hypothetical protein
MRASDDDGEERRTNSLAALALTLGLVVVGLYLIDELRIQGRLQDCVLSGRNSCEVQVAGDDLPGLTNVSPPAPMAATRP